MHIANKKDFISALVLFFIMGVFYMDSRRIDLMGGTDLGPLFFPYVMMGIIALLALMLLVSSLSFSTPAQPVSAVAHTAKEWNKDQCIFIALFMVYLLALPFGGYVLSTVVYLLINMIYLGKKENKWYMIYTFSTVGVTALVYYIFAKIMLLFLP